MPLIYDELHRRAEHFMRRERAGHTLQPTALVHEAFVRLVDQKRTDWKSRAHFLAIAARKMREILVDHARRRRAAKRQALARITLDEDAVAAPRATADVLDLHEALERLSAADPRKSQVVELRLFGGSSIRETAEVLGVATSTVINDYRFARAWLRRELEAEG
jgi:RNA polymerase sigma factor (TIGR02999 family)